MKPYSKNKKKGMIYMDIMDRFGVHTKYHDDFGKLITYTDISDNTWYLESDIQRILLSGKHYRRRAGLDNYVKVDLSNYADFDDKYKSMRKERTFISRDDVVYAFRMSTLDPLHRQKFAEWILSIQSLNNCEKLNRFQVWSHDTFGDLLTYTDRNNTVWYLGKDLHKMFKTDSYSFLRWHYDDDCKKEEVPTERLANRIMIDPALLLLHPNDRHLIHDKFRVDLGSHNMFGGQWALRLFLRRSHNPQMKKEIYQWIIDETIKTILSAYNR